MTMGTHAPPSVGDIIGLLETLAPPGLAEDWDNCGLQVGASDWPVNKIWLALDPLPQVVEAAATDKVDLLLTHHPLLFKPLSVIDLRTDHGKIIASAIHARMAIYSAHTNLDSASEGLNDMLADRVDLIDRVPLSRPESSIREGLGGTETLTGLGRIGTLRQPVAVRQLASELKNKLKVGTVRISGNPDLIARRVALCTGSGGSLLGQFLSSDAEVYISGDMRFHDARLVEATGKALIDVGHFATEFIFVDELSNRLEKECVKRGWNLQIVPCRMEQDPFTTI